MNSLSLYLTKKLMFMNLVNLSLTIIKDAFDQIRGKLGKLPNQRRETVDKDITHFLLKNMIRYHHNHHVTPILFYHSTPLLPMDHQLYHITCHPYPLHGSNPSSCYPSTLAHGVAIRSASTMAEIFAVAL